MHELDAQRAESSITSASRIDLAGTELPIEREHAQAFAALADKLGVTMQDIAEVYKTEFDRLAAGARVTNFLIVLALNRTRSILQSRRAKATVN